MACPVSLHEFQEMPTQVVLQLPFVAAVYIHVIVAATVCVSSGERDKRNSWTKTSCQQEDVTTAMRNLIILNDVPRMTIQERAFDQSLASYSEKRFNDRFSQDPGTTSGERNFLKQL